MLKKPSLRRMAFLLFLAVSNAGAQEEGSVEKTEKAPFIPFSKGEKLVYAVRYLGITAGEAVLAVSDPILFNGRTVYPLLSTIQSNNFVSRIYPVSNRVESYLDAIELYSHRIDVKQREGSRKREKQIVFDQQEHTATQIKDNQREIFPIPPRAHDFLSVLYYLRAQHPLTISHSMFVDVHESGKSWKLEVRVLGKESVTTPSGTFETIKVQVLSRFEGLFLTRRDLFIWMTDDRQKIPVKIQSKITVGSIILVLTSAPPERGAR